LNILERLESWVRWYYLCYGKDPTVILCGAKAMAEVVEYMVAKTDLEEPKTFGRLTLSWRGVRIILGDLNDWEMEAR